VGQRVAVARGYQARRSTCGRSSPPTGRWAARESSKLEEWLQTEESKSVGQSDGGSESKGHESGRRIVEILRKKKSEYTDDNVEHMKRVNGYVKRHLGQGPKNNPEDSKWRYSFAYMTKARQSIFSILQATVRTD